jgi:hypothetical protein
VSGNYFDVLGIKPYLGRFIQPEDEQGANSAPYVVLTYAYWHTHFHDDPGAIGRAVRVNKHPFSIIGVAPPTFRGTVAIFSPDFFTPLVNSEQVGGTSLLSARGSRWIAVVGHVRTGITNEQAVADLDRIGASLAKTYPKNDEKLSFALGRPGLGGDESGGPMHAFLTALSVLAALILLAACANLGSLFAATPSNWRPRFATRCTSWITGYRHSFKPGRTTWSVRSSCRARRRWHSECWAGWERSCRSRASSGWQPIR